LSQGRDEQADVRYECWFAEQLSCISVIVAAEIRYGLERRAMNAGKRQLIEAVLERRGQPCPQ
jgi:predicted nucleic acid-binding protein